MVAPWYEDVPEEASDIALTEYDITASPNDFNISTIFNFIESGSLKIPVFQRNYVWDVKRASKLIESIIIGLPVPQIFLFEESRNKFLVIDGQQRLMSIYYFIKGRFPQKAKRAELRTVFDLNGHIPDRVLHDDVYFSPFNLQLSDSTPPNPLHASNYHTLGDRKTTFDLRTIRNVIIKQNLPKDDDDSSMYEIFNRLNSGGVNLWPQEIRASLYHSDFYTMLYKANTDWRWRSLLGVEEPDLHMKDIETILRGFALLIRGKSYRPSMTGFLNESSRQFKRLPLAEVVYLEQLFYSFLDACSDLPPQSFYGKGGGFTISIYDAVFASFCSAAFEQHDVLKGKIDPVKLSRLKEDTEFFEASQSRTAGKGNVKKRLSRAIEMLS
ncbi:MAG TPA: DUF262 domain-containing protein [Terriglobales bacterium]|nr:DUF262 domain-containing protein [Terriglobales bacterium]